MAAGERVKIAVSRQRRRWQSALTVATILLGLFPATVTAQEVDCYVCDTACDSVAPEQTIQCAGECGVWYSSSGSEGAIEVARGCIESAPEGATVHQRCPENRCNVANPVRCLRCESVYSSECAEVVCPGTDDQCYLNAADGHRGCTSDPAYGADCRPAEGDGRCSLCSSPPSGGSCNGNIRCVVCDGSDDERCLHDPASVERCLSSTDRCYRYIDITQTLHMGCTSSTEYLTNCYEPRNCRTCATSECNRDDEFSCYTCSDCPTVDKSLYTPLECTIFETDRCYDGYDWQNKETTRGCASEELIPFDAIALCYESGCNERDYPAHLQCYQCVGCDQISPQDVNYCQSDGATGCFMLLSEDRTLVRGCNTDEAYAGECREDQNCVTCRGDRCNGGPKTVPIFCFQCAGVEECEAAGSNVPYSCIDTAFYNRCYMYADTEGTLVKGCLLDLEPGSELATACYDPDDPRCQYCAGFSCNQLHCVSCDTRTEGLACILGLGAGAGSLRYEMCAAGGCLVAVDSEGHTVRGCADTFPAGCEGTLECEVTALSGTNGALFPAERRRCYQCTGEPEDGGLCRGAQDETSGQYCPLYYGDSDGCYVYEDASSIVRGCTTDPDARCTTGDLSAACQVSGGSLSNGAAQQAQMSCYQDCPGGGPAELVPSCPPSACSVPNARCFLSVSHGGVISRGCTTAFQGCPPDSHDCFLCDEPNCNGVYAVCATCDTLDATDCSVGAEHGDVCAGSAGCFHYAEIDREIYGCAESAPAICTDDRDHCQFCADEPFCNAKAMSFCFNCIDCGEVYGSQALPTKICALNGDPCFTGLFGGTRVDRGCYAEMPEPIAQYRELQRCTSPFMCNDLERADVASCYVCTDCAAEPHPDDGQLCVDPVASRCYVLLDEDRRVRRGCTEADALPDGCVEGLNCAVCTGEDNCNGMAVSGVRPTPESPGFSCVQCDGGAACRDYNVVGECRNEAGLLFDGCVTYVQGDLVRKGCLSDAPLWELCGRVGSEANPACTVSRVTNGNAREIVCYTCSGASSECVREQHEGSVTASFEHGGCLVSIGVDGTLERANSPDAAGGCATVGGPLCTECFTDRCNGDLFPADRPHCYQCAGEACAQLSGNGGGATQFASWPCLKYDATGGRRQCYTRFEGEGSLAERGCLSDDEVCTAPAAAPCELCSGDGCNDAGYGTAPETLTCVSCSSSLQCETSPTVAGCSEPALGCFTFFSGRFVIAKGCVADVVPSSAWYSDCSEPGGNERCQHCTGDTCNGNRCFTCSSLDDGRCLEPTIGLMDSSACPTPGECVAFIDDAGHTVRGCAADYSEVAASGCSEESETCARCLGDYCNGGPVPRNRIKCQQCAGTGGDCLDPRLENAQYCPLYDKGRPESCYTYFADEHTVDRGCVTDRTEPDCTGFCQTCGTSACNDQPALARNALRCVQCDGTESCASAANVPEPCTVELLLGRTDRCYTFFDQRSGAVARRGCVSGLTEPEAVPCRDGDDPSCKLCSPDGCNARSVECVVCDSESNPACAGNMLAGSWGRQCGTGLCVSLLRGAITWKGCAEDFEEECDAPDASRCTVFDGHRSNGGIFPSDRLQCYQCRGNRNACGQIAAGREVGACQRYDPSDECYVYVSDTGETVRGCMSDPVEIVQCPANDASCLRCATEGCNDAPSERTNWLTCAKCSQATECANRELDPIFEPCGPSVLLGRHDSCYTYRFGTETLARGCLSEADASIRARCRPGESGECSVCHCDRCNGPPTECVRCVGERGCGDVSGGNMVQCRTGGCLAYSKRPGMGSDTRLTIVKGCSEDYAGETCARGPPGAAYRLCQSAGCNDVLYPPGRIRCYQCAGESCSDETLQPTICEPYRDVSLDACYSFLDRQQKGCLGALDDGQLQTCLEAGGTEGAAVCKVCSTADGCNVDPPVLQCTVCSSQTDPNCADPVRADGPATTRKPCPTGGCATFIDAEGFTVKGCAVDHGLTEALCAAAPAACVVCATGDACNDGLRFPADRLECLQCTGGSSCLDMAAERATACRRYEPDDACYTYATGPTSVVRGCLSDRPSTCSGEETACVTCQMPVSGCNTDPALVPNERSCHQCSGVDCAEQRTGAGTICPGMVLLGRTDSCYTLVDTYSVRRGCVSADDACDPASNANCHVCSAGDDCNGDGYDVATSQCIQCDERTEQEACRWGYAVSEATRCQEDVAQAGAVAGCYSCYNDAPASDPPFRRGCMGDGGEQRCQADTLAVCLGSGCNNRNERLQICAKCDDVGCETDRWLVEECHGTVPYARRGCYIMRDARKRILARGCVADLDEADWQRCANARDGSCTTCLENQCNRAGRTTVGQFAATSALLLAVVLPVLHRFVQCR